MLAERQTEAQSGTWEISQPVRRILARTVLNLRAELEDDFSKQLRALGIREDGIKPPPVGRALPPAEQHARDVAIAVIRREVEGGATSEQAFETYSRDSAFTFLNRMVGLRCLDERGLLMVDGQPETVVKVDPARNASSLYWRVRNELGSTAPPREVWREALRRAGTAISQQVRVLFDPDSEYSALLPLQPALQQVVDALNTPEVPSATYAQDEFLGWVYQYYNAQEKDEAYARLKARKKLERPEELIAATCLYTEPYMVDYLLQNTLGALWVEMHPNSALPERWAYFVRQPEESAKPPRSARPLREITLLDPACGSGHFLVRAFDLLVAMYREEGREPVLEIPHLILEHNLHGIDIDLRAVQIAALALYLKGCELAGPDFRPRQLNLVAANAILPGDEPPAEYLARFRGDLEAQDLVKSIWRGLKNVREFGSLLHPERAVDQLVKRKREGARGQFWQWEDARWDQWKRELLHGLRGEFERQAQSEDLGQRLFGEEAAKGVSLVEALSRKYEVVLTNPPYAGSKNLSMRLKAFVEREYKEGKRDLYAAFIQRCREFACQGGYIGMVTQQSWLFLRSFAALRKDVLERTSIGTLAHLGEHAFEESAAAGAFVALFTLRNVTPSTDHRLIAFRLVGMKSSEEKASGLLQSGFSKDRRYLCDQLGLLSIDLYPMVYWLGAAFTALLRSQTLIGDRSFVRQGICTTDNEQFVRYYWEVPLQEIGTRWFLFAKGGGFRRWSGFDQYVVDWEDDGRRIKKYQEDTPGAIHWSGRMPASSYFFREGWTFSRVTRGALAVRELRSDSLFGHTSPAVIPHDVDDLPRLGFWINARISTYLLRAFTQGLDFREGHVQRLPLPTGLTNEDAWELIQPSLELRRWLLKHDPTEWSFWDVEFPSSDGIGRLHAAQATYLTAEGVREAVSVETLGLDQVAISAMCEEVGTPCGWYPLIAGYHKVPDPPDDCPAGLGSKVTSFLAAAPRQTLTTHNLLRTKDRLRAIYQRESTGFGALEDDDDVDVITGGEDVEDLAASGGQMHIPTETFLEGLSQELKIHPISVYRLLQEMREQEGLLSVPELRRHLEDFASVTILRLLGNRWPEQEKYEQEHLPIIDPELVDDDGVIPLVPCADQPTVLDRMRLRLDHDFGPVGAEHAEREFRRWVGRDLGDWLRRDFFKRHVQQFKQRPIAWHLVSPERTFEAYVLYHKLSRATLQKLRAQYAGELIARLRSEQDRARHRGAAQDVSRLQFQIEDVEEFRTRLEKIERGDELKYRIRCRWNGEEDTGRPGPYAPDIDEGVKVNIRPFQEAGLLAVREVIKKW